MASILIVDDDEGMVETLADILTVRSYTVSTANSGEAAIAEVERTPFDLVLMDVRMPGLDGVRTLEAMKRRDPGLKVILMTAFTREWLIGAARKADAIAVVPKPLDLDATLGLVDRVVRSDRDVAGGA